VWFSAEPATECSGFALSKNSNTAEAAVLEPLKNLLPANTGSLLVLKGTTSCNTPATAPVALLSKALQAALAVTAEH
jgi:hypothetical protein